MWTCPKCKADVDFETCWNCQTEKGQVDAVAEKIVSHFCPNCRGTNFQTLEMIHAGGMSHVDTQMKMKGGVVGTGGLGFGTVTARTSGYHQSDLSRKAAQPEKKDISGVGCVGACLLFLVALLAVSLGANPVSTLFSIIGFFVLFRMILPFLKDKEKENLLAWQDEYAKWKNTYMCLQCGTKFPIDTAFPCDK